MTFKEIITKKLGKIMEKCSADYDYFTDKNNYRIKLDRDIHGYKKGIISNRDIFHSEKVRIKLLIPKGTEIIISDRHDFGHGKCRAAKAKVISITRIKAKRKVRKAESLATSNFKYIEGKFAHPDRFDRSPKTLCSHGIHFYFNTSEANAHH